MPLPTIPARIARLPRDRRGFPVPWFVTTEPAVDFRLIRQGAFEAAMNPRRRRCWICGDDLGRAQTFVAGPMCGINRISSEPPSHLDCARFAAQACPFLANPRMRRNGKDIPDDAVDPPGIFLDRNPGVAMLWTCRDLRPIRTPDGGLLLTMGDPVSVEWWREGRPATRAEVVESIRTGLPALLHACDQEPTDGERAAARAELDKAIAAFEPRLPPVAIAA